MALVAKSTVTSAVMSAAETVLPATKGDFCQTSIEIGVEVFHAKLATLDQRRYLIIVVGPSNRTAFEAFCRVANPFHDGGKALKLGAPFPHGDERLVFRR